MTTITIELPDERVAQLRERAARLGITLEELVRVSVTAAVAAPDPELHAAIDHVLTKNRDLYRRLA